MAFAWFAACHILVCVCVCVCVFVCPCVHVCVCVCVCVFIWSCACLYVFVRLSMLWLHVCFDLSITSVVLQIHDLDTILWQYSTAMEQHILQLVLVIHLKMVFVVKHYSTVNEQHVRWPGGGGQIFCVEKQEVTWHIATLGLLFASQDNRKDLLW